MERVNSTCLCTHPLCCKCKRSTGLQQASRPASKEFCPTSASNESGVWNFRMGEFFSKTVKSAYQQNSLHAYVLPQCYCHSQSTTLLNYTLRASVKRSCALGACTEHASGSKSIMASSGMNGWVVWHNAGQRKYMQPAPGRWSIAGARGIFGGTRRHDRVKVNNPQS